MSKTHRHKAIAKFAQGLIEWKDLPLKVKLMGWRHNYEWGYFRNLRNIKRIKEIDHESNN